MKHIRQRRRNNWTYERVLAVQPDEEDYYEWNLKNNISGPNIEVANRFFYDSQRLQCTSLVWIHPWWSVLESRWFERVFVKCMIFCFEGYSVNFEPIISEISEWKKYVNWSVAEWIERLVLKRQI